MYRLFQSVIASALILVDLPVQPVFDELSANLTVGFRSVNGDA